LRKSSNQQGVFGIAAVWDKLRSASDRILIADSAWICPAGLLTGNLNKNGFPNIGFNGTISARFWHRVK
jgi:hypothetical protein